MPWCPAHLLDQGETAIWWGRPSPGRYLLRRNVLLGVFAIVCFSAPNVFAIIWLVENTTGWLLFVGTLFSVIVAVVFWAGLVWWAVDRWNEANGTTYLLTDKRAVIATPTSAVSMAYPSMRFIDLEAVSAEMGTVLFHEYWVDGEDGQSLVRDGFIGIVNAHAVAQEMRRLQAAAP